MSQSTSAISGEGDDAFVAEATAAMAQSTADAHQYQDEAALFQHEYGTTQGRDVTAGQIGDAGGSGYMRGPEHLVKEAGSEG